MNGTKLPYEIKYGDYYTFLPRLTEQKIGHTLKWITEVNGKKIEIKENTKMTIPKDHDVNETWKVNNYTIKFVFNNSNNILEKSLYYGDIIVYPKDPVKEGYLFGGWDPNPECMPARNFTTKALWTTYMIIINFDKKKLGNTNVTEKIKSIIDRDIRIDVIENDNDIKVIIKIFENISDNDVKNYVDAIKEDEDIGKSFIDYEVQKGKVVTEEDKDSSIVVVVCVLVIVTFVIIVALFAVLALFMIKREQKIKKDNAAKGTYKRVVVRNVDTLDTSTFKSRFSKKDEIYPQDYVPPKDIVEALLRAGLDKEAASEVNELCKYTAEQCRKDGKLFGNFTIEDAATVSMYTFDFGGDRYEMNPYWLLNNALRTDKNKVQEIVRVRDIVYLVVSSLRKLPVVKGVTLYRGIRNKVSTSQYKEGSVVVWPGFSSTSPDMNTTKAFLTKIKRDESERSNEELEKNIGVGLIETTNPSEEEEVPVESSGGTLFVIEDGWGYNVQPYSQFPDEEEILLEPEREFDVVSVTDSGDLLFVSLRMKKTPVILPEMFGEPVN